MKHNVLEQQRKYEPEHGQSERSDNSGLLYATTDDGVTGVVRDRPPRVMTINNGKYFVPIEDDAGYQRQAALLLLEAIDSHYPDSEEFAELYDEAKQILGI